MFGRIREQISENPRRSQGFSPAREFSQTLPRFSPGYEGTVNRFYFYDRIIVFRLNKEKDDKLYEARIEEMFDTSFFFSEEKTSESLTGIEPMTL